MTSSLQNRESSKSPPSSILANSNRNGLRHQGNLYRFSCPHPSKNQANINNNKNSFRYKRILTPKAERCPDCRCHSLPCLSRTEVWQPHNRNRKTCFLQPDCVLPKVLTRGTASIQSYLSQDKEATEGNQVLRLSPAPRLGRLRQEDQEYQTRLVLLKLLPRRRCKQWLSLLLRYRNKPK